MINRIIAVLILLMVFSACSANRAEMPHFTTPTPNRVGTMMNEPTLPPLTVSSYIAPTTVTDGGVAVPEPPLPAKPCDAEYEHTRPQYTLEAVLDWDNTHLEVDEQVHYINTTGAYQEALVFQVEPNRLPAVFALTGIQTDDNRRVENVTLDANRMVVPLPGGLGENCEVTLTLSYSMTIPRVGEEYIVGRIGYFGATANQINLGHWMPVLALYGEDTTTPVEIGWRTPQSVPPYIGEQTITEASDFEVTLQVIDAPQGIVAIGPGNMHLTDTHTWEFDLKNARDLSISVSDGIRRTSTIADNGTVIELYYFPANEPPTLSAAEQSLESAKQALVLFEELFGLEYPYQRLVIVQGNFPDGMEFSGLVFVSQSWFKGWRGQPNDWLTVITVHEVAHQWWYALVGNDPSRDPYLDEAFATYSEYLYYERYYPDYVNWWWDFRVRPHTPQGAVDADIYTYSDARSYINAVYLRGAEMLHSIRQAIGDEAFFGWLRSYAVANEHQIATSITLWEQLNQEQYAASEAIRQQYFQEWRILPETTAEIAVTEDATTPDEAVIIEGTETP